MVSTFAAAGHAPHRLLLIPPRPFLSMSDQSETTCPKCQGPMWDNRATKTNPRQPDFKCKNAPKQRGEPGCEGVIWPPRDPNAPAPAPSAPKNTADDPACPSCGGKMWDNRTTKRSPKAPDFKCRNGPKYPSTEGCPGVIWPPKDGQAPAASAPAASSKPQNNDFADFPGGMPAEDEDLPF